MERILDWNKYLDTAAKMVSEGIVMLKNENNALPLDTDKEVAVFGRIQFHYYKSGTGSGGMVNVTKVVNILDGLIDNGVKVNEKLLDTYRKWDKENPFDLGEGWGGEPWSQKEMPLDEGLVKETAKSCRNSGQGTGSMENTFERASEKRRNLRTVLFCVSVRRGSIWFQYQRGKVSIDESYTDTI